MTKQRIHHSYHDLLFKLDLIFTTHVPEMQICCCSHLQTEAFELRILVQTNDGHICVEQSSAWLQQVERDTHHFDHLAQQNCRSGGQYQTMELGQRKMGSLAYQCRYQVQREACYCQLDETWYELSGSLRLHENWDAVEHLLPVRRKFDRQHPRLLPTSQTKLQLTISLITSISETAQSMLALQMKLRIFIHSCMLVY